MQSPEISNNDGHLVRQVRVAQLLFKSRLLFYPFWNCERLPFSYVVIVVVYKMKPFYNILF